MLRRAITTGLTLLLVISLTACSSANNFVIVNESSSELEVRYRIKRFRDVPLTVKTLPNRPVIKPIAEVDQQIAWHDLSDSEIELDSQARIVTVRLMPGYALRVERLNLRDNANAELTIDELFLNGASGQTHLQGREVQNSFTPGPTYLLRYQ
jgi:hypothetical protein